MDTPEVIDLDKLQAVGQVAGMALLGLTEGEPAVHDLLARRAAAVVAGDVDAFLATSLPDLASSDRFWFADLRALSAARFEMQARDVCLLGRTATATVDMALEYPAGGEGGEARRMTASLPARFTHTEDGWRWGGANLVWAGEGAGFAVAHPPGQAAGLGGLGRLAAERYAAMATRLGLPPAPDAALLLFPGPESLRASTALSSTRGRAAWVAPGRVKLVYRREISASAQLTDTLTQLLLAEAGVTRATAPWLWQGLPLALGDGADGVEAQLTYLPPLRRALAAGTSLPGEAASWAAIDYLRQQVGWRGVGRFIEALGRACRAGRCGSGEGENVALRDALGMDLLSFEAAWQAHWRERLAAAQAGLDAVLAARAEAILARDATSFLNTVDPVVPHLMAEQQAWFSGLAEGPLDSLSVTGEPLAWLEDGRVLARVTLAYRLAGSTGRGGEGTASFDVLFTPGDEGYRWTGVPFERLPGARVTVLYPGEGHRALAQAVLDEAEAIYPQLAAELGVDGPDRLTVKLYDDTDAFRASVSLAFPVSEPPPGWAGKGGAVKLRLPRDATPDDCRPVLAAQLARHLLYQMGVESEWLLKGVSVYLSPRFDGGAAVQAAAEELHRLPGAISRGGLADLQAMPPDGQLSGEERRVAKAQAWDTVRYLVGAHGWEALRALLRGVAQGRDVDAALQGAIGQSLPEFEAAWADSIARAHALPEWIDVAVAFDAEGAEGHVRALADPALAGRRAGSAGAAAAATYIAARFAEYGLVPVGGGGDAAFLQSFPITHTALLSAPRFELVDGNGRIVETFAYRHDFVARLGGAAGGGTAMGELVWVRDGDYQGLELAGKIVLRRPSHVLEVEVARAVEGGAEALILVGEREGEGALWAKELSPVDALPESGMPVLELTRPGYLRLSEAIGRTPADVEDSPPALPLGVRASVGVSLSPPEAAEAANVLGLLPGSDPVLRDELIVLGAHYDHVGDDPAALACPLGASIADEEGRQAACVRLPGKRYPGANDDASGVGVLLEIARLWQATGYRPRRSLLFAAWGAQELGEVGSTYYVAHPVFPLEQTVAVLQLDAVGGGEGYFLEAQGTREREGLLLFSMTAAADWVDGRLTLRGPSGRSDHVPFRDAGLPALLLTWRGASEDNWPAEIADEVEPYRLGVTGRMVTLALMSLAR
jgi:hypothetical protein